MQFILRAYSSYCSFRRQKRLATNYAQSSARAYGLFLITMNQYEGVEMDDDSIKYTCFCGAHGTWNELHNSDGLDKKCGGTGMLYCHCGGDLCVCHNHGEVECFGCEDCEDQEFDDFDYGYAE